MAKAQKKQKLAIRKDDMVIVLSGEGRSKTPRKVLSVLPYEGKVVVEGVNLIKDSQKANQQGGQGGSEENFVEKAYPIHASKVALVDPKSGKQTRVRFETGKDGKKQRVAVKSGQAI
jgi:large subunit ribosomal protein L24